jgi:WS/DGAT/MGAT family acyltransferase
MLPISTGAMAVARGLNHLWDGTIGPGVNAPAEKTLEMTGRCVMERLTAQDLSMLWPDEFGWPQDIGALGILDSSALLGADGQVTLEKVRQAVEDRLSLVPRFRQCLWRPRRGFGSPLWVDASDFDIARHVEVFSVRPPGDEVQLLRTVERLRRRPFDRSRPLWRLWLLPGLSDGRVAFYLRVHHSIADGVAGVATLGALLDPAPDAPAAPRPPFVPAGRPSTRDLFIDNVLGYLRALTRVLLAIVHLGRTIGRVRAVWPAVRETLGSAPAPRSSINCPIGSRRSFALIEDRLDPMKQVAHRHGATVNDVLMAAIAGGLSDLLRARGERVDGVTLRAYVPVSLRHDQPEQARGNQDGIMAVPLPIGVPDPVRRLSLIAEETTVRKKRSRPPGGALLRNRMIQRAMLRRMSKQRWANIYVANVPGPSTPLYLAGARVLQLFPVVPLIGNVTVGVGALSYAGRFAITVVADGDACPDVEVFARGVRGALRLMTRSELADCRIHISTSTPRALTA